MKIAFLFLDSIKSIGGIQKFNKNFILALDRIALEENYTVSCFSVYDKIKYMPQLNNIKFWSADGNKQYYILYTLWHTLKSDIIILGHLNLTLPYTALLRAMTLFSNKKIILVAHGVEVWKLEYFRKKNIFKNFDTILTVSQYTKDQLIKLHHVSENKISIFPNTLDPNLKLFPMDDKPSNLLSRYKLKKTDKIILTLCRIAFSEKDKGYENVIKALVNIKKVIPNIKYILAGPIEKEEKVRLQQYISENELDSNVVFTGVINDYEINSHYNLCDLFIMPSKKEGFGIVFLEALSCGKPVVAGNADGSIDALLNGELGMLVDPASLPSIELSILDFFNKKWPQYLYDSGMLRYKALNTFDFHSFKTRLKTILQSSI